MGGDVAFEFQGAPFVGRKSLRETVVVIHGENSKTDPDLLQVVDAVDAPWQTAGRHRWQQHPSQQYDDGQDDQRFDQGDGAAGVPTCERYGAGGVRFHEGCSKPNIASRVPGPGDCGCGRADRTGPNRGGACRDGATPLQSEAKGFQTRWNPSPSKSFTLVVATAITGLFSSDSGVGSSVRWPAGGIRNLDLNLNLNLVIGVFDQAQLGLPGRARDKVSASH